MDRWPEVAVRAVLSLALSYAIVRGKLGVVPEVVLVAQLLTPRHGPL